MKYSLKIFENKNLCIGIKYPSPNALNTKCNQVIEINEAAAKAETKTRLKCWYTGQELLLYQPKNPGCI